MRVKAEQGMPSLTRDKSRFLDFHLARDCNAQYHWSLNSQLLLSPNVLVYLAMERDSAYVCGVR